MYQVIFKPRAIEMQRDAYLWYEQQNEGLGELFLKELDYCYRKIQSFPSAYTLVNGNYRQMSLKRFPYVIVFKIKDVEILIYAVFHTSRNPKEKIKR